jgi:glycosyltransferase involved in cell wall biosynthesis
VAADRPLRILALSTTDRGGGAERIAAALVRAARARGHEAWLAVGRKRGDDPDVLTIPDRDSARNPWERLCWAAHDALGPPSSASPWLTRARNTLRRAARPSSLKAWLSGLEDFDFPGSRRLLTLAGGRPDLIHAHNLHGWYFDLRTLPALAREVPVLLTLHDMWLLTGHCAHSFACDRWERGCGSCPDLGIYPSVPRDRTADNWRRKRDLYAAGRFFLAAPCAWLLDRARRSMLAPAIAGARLIPHGVDRSVFRPSDRREARRALGLSEEGPLVLVMADGLARSMWKDAPTLRDAVARLAGAAGRAKTGGAREAACAPRFLALGRGALPERIGEATIHFSPYQPTAVGLARHYQAADLYLHAARADTFPTTVLEALACGTPVVATAVGGIPEQIRGHAPAGGAWDGALNPHGAEEGTGSLVPPGNGPALAEAAGALLGDAQLLARLSENAARDARARFDAARCAQEYLAYYAAIAAKGDA